MTNLHTPIVPLSMSATIRPASFYLHRRDPIELDTAYQRGSVWDDTRRRNLIHSLLSGIPVGAIILNKRPQHTGKYIGVIDGRQRIEALRAVADGQLAIPAAWIPARFRGATTVETIDGESIEVIRLAGDGDIDHPFRRMLENFAMPTLEASVATIAEEARIFEQVNFGGVPQTAETRARAARIVDGA